MGGSVFANTDAYTDIFLVPLSLFVTLGYHACLWHNFKNNPSLTTIGNNVHKKRLLFQDLQQGDAKKGTLAVQSLRNTLMETILTATITIVMMVALAALCNNSYKANDMFNRTANDNNNTSLLLGLHSREIIVLKYGASAILLLFSFLCSSLALGSLVDVNVLVNSTLDNDEADVLRLCAGSSSMRSYTCNMLEQGCVLAVAGSRLMCIAFPLMMWMLSPVLVIISSLALVWGLYALDFN